MVVLVEEQLGTVDMGTITPPPPGHAGYLSLTAPPLSAATGPELNLFLCPLFVIRGTNRFIGEVVQSRRRPLLGPSPG